MPRLQAEQYWQNYYAYYHQGLQQPLMLGIHSAFRYLDVLAKNNKTADDALQAAVKTWKEEVADDVYWRQVTPENQRDILPKLFVEATHNLYMPLIKHSQELTWTALADAMLEYAP